MKTLQFYKYTTWGLLALNLLLLTFFVAKQLPFHGGMRALDALKLDKQQHTEFLVSAQKHGRLIKEIQIAQKGILRTYFTQLVASPTKLNVSYSLTTYEALESEKIKVTYQHFKEIKDFLRAEQYADFEKFVHRMLIEILPDSKELPHPPKDF